MGREEEETHSAIGTNSASPATDLTFGKRKEDSSDLIPAVVTDREAPDGGIAAWMQVIGGFFVWMNTLGIVNSYGEFQSFYQVDLLRDKAPTSIAWIGSTHAAMMFSCGIIAGPLFDKGYFYYCQIFGSILIVLGYMMTSLCKSLWQFVIAQGICVGLGSGLVFIPMVGLIAQWFSSKRGLANGLASSGSGVAGIIYPIIFRRLQEEVGFAWAVRSLGFIVFATQLSAIALLRLRFKPTQTRAFFDRSISSDYAFLMLILPIIPLYAACYVPWNYLPAFAIESKITGPNLGFYILAIINASSVLGRLVLSALADKRIGIVNMSIILVFLTGVLCFAWIGVHDRAGLIIFALVIGFIGGGLLTLMALVPMSFTTDPAYTGTRLGMCMLLGGLCLLWGTPVAGSLIDDSRSYTRLEAYAGGLLLSTAFLLVIARVLRTGPNMFVKF